MGLAGHARHVLQERCALHGPVHPFGTSHPTARLGESGNGQSRPRGQDLVVQPGLGPSRSRTVPPFGHLLQRILDSGDLGSIGPQRRIAFRRPSQDVHALFPEAAPVQVKHGLNVLLHGRVRQCGRHIGFAPHVVQSLCAVAVCIQGGFEPSAVVVEFTKQKRHDAFCRRLECGLGLVRQARCLRQSPEKLAVVVQHLFEMRHVPTVVYAVPRKPATHVVVDATPFHAPKGAQCMVLACRRPLRRPFQFCRLRKPKPKRHLTGQRKFGGALRPAMRHVPGCFPFGQPLRELTVNLLCQAIVR